MQFLLLGPVEVERAGERVPVTRAKVRAVLVMLLIEAGRAVAVDRLIDGLWGEHPPHTATKILQTYVSQLRTLLEPARSQGQLGAVLVTEASGYRLRIDPSDVDAKRFEELLAQGQALLPDEPAAARRVLAEALGLWRGPALADFAGDPFAQGEIARLEELRLVAVEERVEADLALGLHAAVVGELREHLRGHPLRERMWAQLMLALYRSGRQGDALAAYRGARRMLNEELGIDPGRPLQRLEQRILLQDADLELSPAAPEAPAQPTSRAVVFADERRWATVLYAELQEAAPSDRVLERLRHEARRHGGEVVADNASILALFGAPVAHEDDAERAVRAGLAIQDLARSMTLPSAPLTVRIGVGTGELRTEGETVTVAGEAAATARDLARKARPGDVLVAAATMRATGGAISYEPVGPAAWRAVGADRQQSRRPLSATLLVGRQAELGLLRTLWERTVSERRPHLVTVLGPPGIGKSRLTQEFLPLVDAAEGLVLRGRSLPYGDATFGSVAQIIRSAVGVGESDMSQALRWKLEAWLEMFLPPDERARAAQYLISLLAVVGDLVLPQQKQVMHESVRRFLEMLASRQPIVLVFEDIHWAHSELLDLLESLAARLRSAALLAIAVTRPELLDERPGWGGGLPAYVTLPVDALSLTEARQLAGALVADHNLPDTLIDTVQEVSGGNPLFIEELAAWAAEGHHLTRDMPATVRAVISSRLDLLPAVERSVLVDASVMGDPFWRGGLERLSRWPAREVDDALESLRLRGLIHPQHGSSISGDREFGFRHELFAEVAYATLLAAVRADKHLRVATYLEGAGGEAVGAAVLARHWREAGDLDRAVTYLVEAADQANHGWERSRAVALYNQALELLADRDAQRWRSVNLKRAVALQAWAHVVLDVGHLRMAGREEPIRGESRQD